MSGRGRPLRGGGGGGTRVHAAAAAAAAAAGERGRFPRPSGGEGCGSALLVNSLDTCHNNHLSTN